MRYGIRFRVLLASALLIASVGLLAILEDKCDIYDPVSFLEASIPGSAHGSDDEMPLYDTGAEDKIIVVPAGMEDDTSWITQELFDWQHAIYLFDAVTRDERQGHLTIPANKGNEAMAYLTYIIDHYHTSIPSVVAFLHSHRSGFFKAWHVDTPLHDNVNALQNLQLAHVREKGYVNLRCNWNPGCKRMRKSNSHLNRRIWWEIFGSTSTPFFNADAGAPAAVPVMSSLTDSNVDVLEGMPIWTPCCAQFAVSREQIYQRPFEDYVKIRSWLLATHLSDARSGRVMEFLWHVVFGMEASHCPDQATCYCEVYGRC